MISTSPGKDQSKYPKNKNRLKFSLLLNEMKLKKNLKNENA